MIAPLSAVRDDLTAKLREADLREAMEATFTPTPLDLLCLAELRRTSPELAMELATKAGQQFDRRIK